MTPDRKEMLVNSHPETVAEMTVGNLVDRLAACDRDAPVRLAINPFFPMAHRLAKVVEARDETGRSAVYLAEGRDGDEQLGHLPPEVAIALTWHEPVQAPRRPRRAVRPADGK